MTIESAPTLIRYIEELSELAVSTLDLYVVGSGEDLLMIEMRALASEKIDDIEMNVMNPMMPETPIILEHQECNELSELELIDAIAIAGKAIKKATEEYTIAFTPFVRETLPFELEDEKIDPDIYSFIADNFNDEVNAAIMSMAKSERSTAFSQVKREVISAWEAKGKVSDSSVIRRVLAEYKR